MVNPDQLRAARALLGLQQIEVAKRAGISVVTLRRLEDVNGGARMASETATCVRAALEEAGAEFIDCGVRRAMAPDPTLLDDLRAISLRSAARLAGIDLLTDDDLYDEGGLPT